MGVILVLTTANTMDLAQRIASGLVESGEVACVNIVPGLRSIYRWQGKICDDSELLLLAKTTERRFEAVRSTIRRLHTYQLPEVIAVPIVMGDAEYLRWIEDQSAIPGPKS